MWISGKYDTLNCYFATALNTSLKDSLVELIGGKLQNIV